MTKCIPKRQEYFNSAPPIIADVNNGVIGIRKGDTPSMSTVNVLHCGPLNYECYILRDVSDKPEAKLLFLKTRFPLSNTWFKPVLYSVARSFVINLHQI